MQEMETISPRNPRMLSELIRILATKQIDAETVDLVRILASYVNGDCKTFRESLSHLDGDQAVLLCSAIGRSGTSCSDLVALLRDKARITASPNKVSIAAQIALASLGVDREKYLPGIELNLSQTTKHSAEEILFPLLLMKSKGWVTDSIVDRLGAIIPKQNEESVLAAVLAASWGKEGRSALHFIRKAAEISKTKKGHQIPFAIYQFCIAKLQRENSSWVTADLLKLVSSGQIGFDHSAISGCLVISGYLLDKDGISDVVRLLGDSDSDVINGAIRLCLLVGLPARAAEQRLLQIVETGKTEEIRAAAAFALGTLASENSMPKLKALVRSEKSESVNMNIKAAITLISLQPVE